MNRFYWLSYRVFSLFIALTSFHIWFFWELNSSFTFWIFVVIICGLFVMTQEKLFHLSRFAVTWFVLLCISLFFTSGSFNIYGFCSILLPCISVFPVMLLKQPFKDSLLDFIFKCLAVLLLVSLIAWIAYIMGLNIPYTMISYGENERGMDLYFFENHYLFLRNTTMISDAMIPRFSSVFLEPGYLGCLMSIILFVRQYKFDWINVIFFVSLAMTLSLAGYLIMTFGYVVYKFYQTRNRLMLLAIIVFFGLFSYGIQNYNNGQNVVNIAIFERLKIDEKTGMIAGYDRSTEETDHWFWNSFVLSPELITGSSNASANLKINDNDWKAYIVKNGLIGLFAYLFFLFYPLIRLKHNRYYCLCFFFIYVLIFAQTIHLIYSMMYIMLYVLGLNRIRTKFL